MAVEVIEGFEFEFREVPASTPRQTGFNGARRISAHVQFGVPDREGWLQFQAPTMAEARGRAGEIVAKWKLDR